MNLEIDETVISGSSVAASQSNFTDGRRVYGMWLRVDDGEDWLTDIEALELRDWINKHFGADS